MTKPATENAITPRAESDTCMTFSHMAGLDKPVSRLIMGCDNQQTQAHADAMFDAYFAYGGNTFDTAYIYGQGLQERLLGNWLKSRNLRDQTVIICKGAHTPNCNPQALTSQLYESLDRLGVDHVDIYMLHRDNLDVPTGEFIDILNEHHAAGRIGLFGGSNWSIERFEQANAYARSRGKQPMSVLSNNFSLARMVDPVWAGCISASDAESRAWHERTQTPNLAWSSQARGFFTQRADLPAKDHPDANLTRCWYSEDNFQRRQRTLELASQYDVLPINIAAAYVLCQPFPSFALFGPRDLEEMRTSLPALNIQLSPSQLQWLNLDSLSL